MRADRGACPVRPGPPLDRERGADHGQRDHPAGRGPAHAAAAAVLASKPLREGAPAAADSKNAGPAAHGERVESRSSPVTIASPGRRRRPKRPLCKSARAPEPPPIIPPRFNADYLQNPAPAYPALARRMHEQGRVLIRVLVSVEGMPERIELKASSGFPRLDQSALETIRSWKFVPARQGEQKIAAWVLVPITFTLDG